MLVKDPQEIRKILEETKTIAVVGFSDDPGRGAAYYVPKHMHEAGYRIIPVNPGLTEGHIGIYRVFLRMFQQQ